MGLNSDKTSKVFCIRGAPDPDAAGYPVNFVDPVRIRPRIRPDPEWSRPDPKSPDPDPARSYLNTTNTEWLNVVS